MSKTAYQKTALTGGGGTALDGIDGAGLLDGDFAYVMVSGTMYVYILNATSGAAESSPDIIAPDTNAGNKRWILQRHVQATTAAAGVTVYSGSTKARAGTDTASAMTPEDVSTAISPIVRLNNQGIAMTAATSGSNGIVVADNDNINFGTGNFTIWFDGLAPDWTPSSAIVLMQKWSSNVGYELGVNTSGYVTLKLNTTTYTSSVANTFTDGTRHKIGAVVTVGASNTTVDFYVDGRPLGTQQTAANPGTVSNSANLYVLGTSSTRTAGAAFGAFTFNRALTADEVLDLYRNGINYADKWGSQTALTVAPFQNGHASTYNYDTYSGASATAFTAVATSGAKLYRSYTTATMTQGKRYRAVWSITVNSGETPFVAVRDTYSSGTVYAQAADATVGSLEFTMTGNTGARTVYFGSSTNTNYTVSNFYLYEIGATLALEPEGIQPAPGQWLDSSSNNLHALQPATGSSLTRSKRDFTIKWTNTWAGTHEVQYIGGLNQAILPPNCYIDSIIGVITGGTIEDIIIGDGSDDNRWVEITTGLAAGTVSFTIVNKISDGTNYKMTVDPDANFTGSIAWTINGKIL